MLDVQPLQPQNMVAPEVFIKSVEIESNLVKVEYYLQDTVDDATGRPYWYDSSEVLSSLYANLVCDGTSSTTLLSNLNKAPGLRLVGTTSFSLTNTGSLYLSASCQNSHITGNISVEHLLQNNTPPGVTYGGQEYENITKIKDLRLLQLSFSPMQFTGSLTASLNTDKFGYLYDSYTIDKKAKVGFIFDLEKYLRDKSPNYNILQNYNKFAKFVLDTSNISARKSLFFIKQSGRADANYRQLSVLPEILKLSDDDSKYLINFTVDGLDSFIYDLKATLWIDDASRTFFEDYVIARLKNAKTIISEYRNVFERYTKSSLVLDPNEYFFKHEYDKEYKYINSAGEAVAAKLYDILSDIALEINEISFVFNGMDSSDGRLLKLFTSILHPLTTNPNLLGRFYAYIEHVERIALQFVTIEQELPQNTQNARTPTNTISKEFIKAIDMTYQNGYGYEVFVEDSKEVRSADNTNGFYRAFGAAAYSARAITETSKYLSNPTSNTRTTLQSYSPSRVDLGDKTYNLSGGNLDVSSANEMYVYLKNYANKYGTAQSAVQVDYSFPYSYDRFAEEFLQISADGISIENLSNRPNTSKNNLFKNTVFDPNNDSKAASLKYIVDTGINRFYFSLQDIKYNNYTGSVMHYSASRGLSAGGSKFVVSDQVLNDPESIYRAVIYYNNLFSFTPVPGATPTTNVQLYSTEPQIIDKTLGTLRQLNKYFLIIYKAASTVRYLSPLPSITKDLLLNIRPELYNRKIVSGANIAISIEDI